jgi:RimJ/RimL family protein N-acetyltransferase
MLTKIDVNQFQDKIEWLWEKVRDQHYFWSDSMRGNSHAFLLYLFRPDSEHFYNNSGMVSVVDIQTAVNGNIHFLLWDKAYPVRQIVEEGKTLFSFMFEKYGFSRITATIPSCNKHVTRLATMLGMKFEGTMRECFLMNGKYYDLFIYGILQREFEEVSLHGRSNGTQHKVS